MNSYEEINAFYTHVLPPLVFGSIVLPIEIEVRTYPEHPHYIALNFV